MKSMLSPQTQVSLLRIVACGRVLRGRACGPLPVTTPLPLLIINVQLLQHSELADFMISGASSTRVLSEALPQLQIQRFTGAFRGCRNTFSSQLRTSAIRVVFKAVSVGHTHKLTAAAVFVLTCQCLFEALRSHMRACIHYRGTSVGVTRFPCSPWGPVLGVKPLSQSLGMKFSWWGPPWVHLLSQSLGMKLPWSLLFWG